MGERIAVKPGSTFERSSSQKKQLALQTERSTVGISMFHALALSDSQSTQDLALAGSSALAADSPPLAHNHSTQDLALAGSTALAADSLPSCSTSSSKEELSSADVLGTATRDSRASEGRLLQSEYL